MSIALTPHVSPKCTFKSCLCARMKVLPVCLQSEFTPSLVLEELGNSQLPQSRLHPDSSDPETADTSYK